MANKNTVWQLDSVVTFSAPELRNTRAFAGSATLYSYTGRDKKVAFAAVIKFTGDQDQARNSMVSNSGGVADAILVAAGLRAFAKLGGAKPQYMDWGGPVGNPADRLQDRTNEEYALIFYKR